MEGVTHSPEETQALGRVLGNAARPGDLFLLIGELGAGKTCFVQGLAWGLRVDGYVRSPTFVFMTHYRGRLPLHHIDLYRIEQGQEAEALGLEEYLDNEGVCVVEWADRAPALFPEEHLRLELEHRGSEARAFRLVAFGARNAALLDQVSRSWNARKRSEAKEKLAAPNSTP